MDHTERSKGRRGVEQILDTQVGTEADIHRILGALPWGTQFGVDPPLDTVVVGEAEPLDRGRVGVSGFGYDEGLKQSY